LAPLLLFLFTLIAHFDAHAHTHILHSATLLNRLNAQRSSPFEMKVSFFGSGCRGLRQAVEADPIGLERPQAGML
jgi:hypothetical protein